jgi:hypothetical protein
VVRCLWSVVVKRSNPAHATYNKHMRPITSRVDSFHTSHLSCGMNSTLQLFTTSRCSVERQAYESLFPVHCSLILSFRAGSARLHDQSEDDARNESGAERDGD